MKDKFSILIINEKTKSNITFSLTKFIVRIYFIFFISLFALIIFLSIKTYQQLPYDIQKNNIHIQRNNLYKILSSLYDDDIINDSLLNQFDILDLYKDYNTIIPIYKPVDGVITQGISKLHNGIDIASEFKSTIFPAQEGLVVFSGETKKFGNTVIISHPNNYFSLYGHMFKSNVKNRQYILQGDIVGYVGKSKNDDGPHLHFELWHNNLIIDPRNFIKDYKLKDVSIK